MEQDFLSVTKKELFYTAVMLQLKQLVNIVYEFPADDAKFEQELNEARSSLRKKKLLTESARNGITLDTALCACAAFCAEPEKCEIIDENNYYATIYSASDFHMLLERCPDDEFHARFFLTKDFLNKYVDKKISEANKEATDDGKA